MSDFTARTRGPRRRRSALSLPPQKLATIAEAALFERVSAAAGASRVDHASGAREASSAMDEVRFASLSGGDVLDVPRRSEYTQTFHLERNATVHWLFRVHRHDVGFSLRRRAMGHGGAVERDIVAPRRFGAGVAVAGSWCASDAPCTVVVCFDNTFSVLRAKRIVMRLRLERPTARTARDDSHVTVRDQLGAQLSEMDSLRAKLDAARAEGARLASLAAVDSQPEAPRAEATFDDADGAPSTASLLAFLDAHQAGDPPPTGVEYCTL